MRSHTSLWQISGPSVGRHVLRSIVLTMLTTLGFAIGSSDVVEGHEHKSTHSKLTLAAFRLLDDDFLRRDPFLPEQRILALLREGVIDEDECIGDKYGRQWGEEPNYHSHFFEPETQEKLNSPTPTPSGCETLQVQMTAPQRAGGLWTLAVSSYHQKTPETRELAFYTFGRILHLLQDMTSPAHVHDDPHGWPVLLVGCGGDVDDFEVWGHCDGGEDQDKISDYVIDGHQATCEGVPAPRGLTCLMAGNVRRLYNGLPHGAEGSADPVVLRPGEPNLGYAFVRHLARITYDFSRFGVILTDPTGGTDVQPFSELRRMLRGSTASDCGKTFAPDVGLCDVGGLLPGGLAWTISGALQEIGRTDHFWGPCGRQEGFHDASHDWWLSKSPCRTVSEENDTVEGFAYIENSGGGPDGFIPVRFDKPLYQKLYGTIDNDNGPRRTLLQIYGDILYPTAVVYSAGLLQAFIDEAARPDADAGGPYTVEACQSITFDGSGSKDPNGTIVLYEWDFDGGGVDVRSLSPTVNAAFQQPGARVVKLTVTDDEALTDDDLANLTVTPDVTPPQIRSAVPSPALLWAPDHQMVPVEIAVSVDDACQSTSCRIVNVTSNEAGSGRGRAARGADWQVIADLKLMLRAERGGGSTERVYTVTVTCVDAAGNQSSRDVLVTVPHDQRR